MRRPVEDHLSQAWEVHRYAADFELLDVWRYPIEIAQQVPLATFLEFLSQSQAELMAGRGAAARLFRLRGWLGRILGWDEKTDARVEKGGSEDLVPFEPVFTTSQEALLEIENATVHALMHLGRVELDGGPATATRWAPQMAVYVRPKGRLGRLYMTLISPFRHWIVYPAMMRAVAQAWPGYLAGLAADAGAELDVEGDDDVLRSIGR